MSLDSKVAQKLDIKPRTKDVITSEHVDFSTFLLTENLLKGLKDAGFEKASPIQIKAIPLGTCGLDLIVQAKSGTGKTCVFTVVALNNVVVKSSSTQVLVLAPTREIAVQTWEVVNVIGAHIEGLRCYTFIGGLPVAEDKDKLKRCHIAVGTPGRVKQLIEEGALSTESVRLFVLDEADKLMEGGFQEVINWIFSSLPVNKQMLAVSATYPESLAQHLTAYMRNPTFIRLNSDDPALMGIRQYYRKIAFHPLVQKAFELKVTELINILSSVAFNQCLVFSNYQARAESLSNTLNAKGWPTTHISGAQDQLDRLTAMATLKKYKCRVLVSTDLTSRGIDAEHINLVINLDIPKDHETYLHRIGRAGRFGSFGAGITLASEGKELAQLLVIEDKCKTTIKLLDDPIPSDLAHSSGYVNLDQLVTTESLGQKVMEQTQTVTTSFNEQELANGNQQTIQHQNGGINQQNIGQLTECTSHELVVNNCSNNSAGMQSENRDETTTKDTIDERSTNDNKGGKRRVLKSKRQGIKKGPWGEWLTTSEDSISSQNDTRECVRDSVSYDDVDIFSNVKPKKTRNKKKQNTTEITKETEVLSPNIASKTSSDSNSAMDSLYVEANKENMLQSGDAKIGQTPWVHDSNQTKVDKSKVATENRRLLGDETLDKDVVNPRKLAYTSDCSMGENSSAKKRLEPVTRKREKVRSGKEELQELSYEQLLASYVHHRSKKEDEDTEELSPDEEGTSAEDKTAEKTRQTGEQRKESDNICPESVMDKQEVKVDNTSERASLVHKENQVDEVEFEKLRQELKVMLYGKRFPKPTVAKCYMSMYDEYLVDLERFKSLAAGEKQEELQKLYMDGKAMAHRETEVVDYKLMCSKVEQMLKHMNTIQRQDLASFQGDSGKGSDLKMQRITTEQDDKVDKKTKPEQIIKGGSSNSEIPQDTVFKDKERKIKQDLEITATKTSVVTSANVKEQEIVKPKKPMFLGMKASNIKPSPVKCVTSHDRTRQETPELSKALCPNLQSASTDQSDDHVISNSSNQKSGNTEESHPSASGTDTSGNAHKFSLGFEYIKKLGALQESIRNNKEESPEEGELLESDENNDCTTKEDTVQKDVVKGKRHQGKPKRANPYGPWEPVESKEENPVQQERYEENPVAEKTNRDDGYYGTAYGRSDECDQWYQEPFEEDYNYTDYRHENQRFENYGIHSDRRNRKEPDYDGWQGQQTDHAWHEDSYLKRERGHHSEHLGDRADEYSYYKNSNSRRPAYPSYGSSHWYTSPFRMDDYQTSWLQFQHAQTAMWASHMNHVYWMGQRAPQVTSIAEQYKYLSDVHSQWADYYRALYKKTEDRQKRQAKK